MPAPPVVMCWAVVAHGFATVVLVYGRDESDIAAGIWDALHLAEGQQVRLELHPESLKLNGRGWVLRPNRTVQTSLQLTRRRI